MKFPIFICLFMFFHPGMYGQIITFTDSSSGKPLEMVYAIGEEPHIISVSNLEGQINLEEFVNTKKITIQRIGYKTIYTSYEALKQGENKVRLMASVNMATAVISASRWIQPDSKIASRVTSITPKETMLRNPQTAADLLGISGEVFIQKSQQGGGSPMIRGFSANRLLYAVDGVRMNTAIFRAGNLQNVISLDAFSMEQTEVLFGPGSVLYGSDAIGGVMSFRTLSPQLSLTGKPLISGKALARFSSANNEKTFHFDVNSGGNKWASRTSITFSDFGNLEMGQFGPDDYLKKFTVQRIDNEDKTVENINPRIQDPSVYRQINLMQKFKYQASRYLNLNYAFHFSETSEYSRYDRLIETNAGGSPVFAVWNYGPQTWMMNQLSLNYSRENRLFDKMLVNLAFQIFEESRIDRRFNQNRLRTQKERVNAPSMNLDFEKNIGNHHLFYGAELVQNTVISRGKAIDISNNSAIAVPDRYPNSSWQSVAAYFSNHLKLSSTWFLQSGIRYNLFEINSDFTRHNEFFNFPFNQFNIRRNSLTGSLGIVYNPIDSWKINLNASSGFRAPNVDDIGKIFEFSEGEIVVPNPQLNAEYAYNAEFGISKVWNSILKVDFNVFYTFLDNALVRRPFKVNGSDSISFNGVNSQVFAVQNAANAFVYGFNSVIELKLPSGFGCISKINFQKGIEEMESGQTSPSRHAAPAFGELGITYTKKGLDILVYLIASDEVNAEQLNEEEKTKPFIYARNENGMPYSPGWYTINFKVRREISQDLSIGAGVENITNQRYRPYSSGLVAPGRNFIISFSALF